MLFSSHEFKKAKPDLFICIEKKLIQNTNKANIKIKRIFGLILIVVILFEPMGLYGRWLKFKTYFDLFPFYRKDMFRRQKTYLKTERTR